MVMFDLPSKQAIKDNKNPVVQDSLKQLIAKADSYLTEEASWVMEKKQVPPSGDKHDILWIRPFQYFNALIIKRLFLQPPRFLISLLLLAVI